MKRIFNWTFGSVFRTFGRILAYLIVGALISLFCIKNNIKIGKLIGIDYISAKTINISSQQYSVFRSQVPLGGNETWTSYVNNGTQTNNNTDNYIILGFRTKFYSSGKYDANTQYQAKVRANTSPKMNYTNAQPNIEFACFGSTSNSSYNPQQNLISSCQLVSVVIEDGNNFTDYIINFTPSTAIETVQFNILFDAKYSMTRINIDNTSTITTDTTTQDAINSQTTNLINNENQNTQNIIDNQNELMGNKCENIVDLSGFNTQFVNGVYFKNNNDGTITITGQALSSFGITFFRPTLTSGNYTFNSSSINAYIYDYSSNTSILTNGETNKTINGTYNNIGIDTWINSGQVFNDVVFKPMITKTSSTKPFCKYGSYSSKLDDTNNAINGLNDTINNDDVSSSQTEASNFFGNFTTNTHGLTGIITAPLNAIQSLTSKSCSPLVLPLPFVNQNLTLPCMREIYTSNFGGFMQLYDVIVIGIIAYWICVRIFGLVKDFKNPEHDEIEVVDL